MTASRTWPPVQHERPYALSIAGLDPSAGAGLLADVKVMEALEVYGLGVCTALTMQHDADFRAVEWVALDSIIAQCMPLADRYPVSVVKIGLVQSLPVLAELTDWLTQTWPGLPIIWDPILKASAGFDFHAMTSQTLLSTLLPRLSLLTPNVPEVQQLAATDEAVRAARTLSVYCPVYLKGGHAEPINGVTTDRLLKDGQEIARFPAPFLPDGEKHGSGCVLSSAIAAGLAKGQPLPEACATARRYMNQYLASSPGLLGFHQSLP
ncbi:hydroxymethylpyrimidine/phosphomethylpyrimidine kinase [Spirosoma sordidisoli]|uniref:hydroxymethylpyrimidine kinase n=1 Tax=Spirosoma sordidisoli TaxID=2502893 RepID=A0A4Q2UV09_9BACT|nr:hydroxymethylpyrimidine/phosphomethylpyrimidine kinase [Spirosoma sordidisoli]RYC71695.1 hydroxymethylpyrimidine/phosphomethylpyrimidine kinase [Spirosoma sordidisoli]